MLHSVLLNLLAAATVASPAAPAAPAADRRVWSDPVVKVWTEWEEYSRGQEAKVSVKTRDDGYLLVMQADVDGRVRVLFPLDPGNDNFVRGGHTIDLPGRGSKKTFYVDGPGGTGMIYAAVSSVPFRFNDFVQGDHWDYGALYDKTMDSDFENGFTVLVDKMSTGHFDYDVYRYTVIAEASYSAAAPAYGPPIYAGSPCWATPYNPWCFGPSWIPGAYLYGPAVGFGYGYGGWSFGISFGFPYYGYGWGAPYYGYGYGYPYYGYGYPYYGYGYGYGGYPYYPHYGYPYAPYVPKGGYPVTGVPYRPAGGVGTTAGIGLATPWRTPGTRGGTVTPVGLGPTSSTIPHRTPTRTGWTLGRPSYANPAGRTGTRAPSQTGSPGTRGGTSANTPHRAPPPRYQPGATGTHSAPSGGQPASAPRGGPPTSVPAPHGQPSAPPPRATPQAPAPRAPAPSAPPTKPSGGKPDGGRSFLSSLFGGGRSGGSSGSGRASSAHVSAPRSSSGGGRVSAFRPH